MTEKHVFGFVSNNVYSAVVYSWVRPDFVQDPVLQRFKYDQCWSAAVLLGSVATFLQPTNQYIQGQSI